MTALSSISQGFLTKTQLDHKHNMLFGYTILERADIAIFWLFLTHNKLEECSTDYLNSPIWIINQPKQTLQCSIHCSTTTVISGPLNYKEPLNLTLIDRLLLLISHENRARFQFVSSRKGQLLQDEFETNCLI